LCLIFFFLFRIELAIHWSVAKIKEKK